MSRVTKNRRQSFHWLFWWCSATSWKMHSVIGLSTHLLHSDASQWRQQATWACEQHLLCLSGPKLVMPAACIPILHRFRSNYRSNHCEGLIFSHAFSLHTYFLLTVGAISLLDSVSSLLSGRAWEDKRKGTNRAQMPIFEDVPPLQKARHLGIADFRGKHSITVADNHRKAQIVDERMITHLIGAQPVLESHGVIWSFWTLPLRECSKNYVTTEIQERKRRGKTGKPEPPPPKRKKVYIKCLGGHRLDEQWGCHLDWRLSHAACHLKRSSIRFGGRHAGAGPGPPPPPVKRLWTLSFSMQLWCVSCK